MFSVPKLAAAAALMITVNSFAAGGGQIVKSDPTKHFDAKGKPPSNFTVEAQERQRAILPFEDKRDF